MKPINTFTIVKANFKLYAENVALESPYQKITYTELELMVNYCATELLEIGVAKGDVIAVIAENEPEFVVLILSIWKIGGIIVLVDASLPLQRIENMLNMSQAKHLISYKPELLEKITLAVNKQLVVPKRKANTILEENLHDLAYIFFTSGTSGQPKGILAPHCSLLHFLSWQQQSFNISPGDKCLQLTRLSFDVILRSVFTGLIGGATIFFPKVETQLSDAKTLSLINEYVITYTHVVPSLMKTWLLQLTDPITVPSLKYIFFAGEKLDRVLINDVRRLIYSQRLELLNLYGPSETVLAKCCFKVPLVLGKEYILPVGYPIDDTYIYIVKNDEIILTPLTEGEIVIETNFKSIGYLNNLQTFKQIPGTTRQGYYTGDTGYIMENGQLMVVGRVDEQIKINGVRIEIEEIDNVIAGLNEIEAAATVFDQTKQQLICYVVSQNQLSFNTIYAQLQQQLPIEMIPHKFVHVPYFIYNTSGKLDRRNLHTLDGILLKRENIGELTNSELGDIVLKILMEVFNCKDISITDNFYMFGGNSLKAALIVHKLEQQLKIKIKISEIFKYSSALELSNYLNSIKQSDFIPEILEYDIFKQPLIVEQYSLVTHQSFYKDSPDYNIAYAFELDILAKNTLTKALLLTVKQIKLLNSTIILSNNQFYYNHKTDDFFIEDIQINPDVDALNILNYIYSMPLDLKHQLARIVLVTKADKLYVCIIIHHAICDGDSSQIFFKNLLNNLNQIKSNIITNKLYFAPVTPLSSKIYWQRYLATYRKPNCFYDLEHQHISSDSVQGKTITRIIPAAVVISIYKLALANRLTEFNLYLSLFAFLTSRFISSEYVMIGVPVSSRQHYNAENEFGCFIKTLPVISIINDECILNDLCHSIQDTVISMLDNYFHNSLFELIDEFGLSKVIDKLNMFDLFFSYDDYYFDEFSINDYVAQRVSINNKTSKFPLSLMLNKMANGSLRIELEFDASRFSDDLINQFLNSYTTLVNTVDSIINLKICNIQYTNGQNYGIYGIITRYTEDKDFAVYIQEKARQIPDKIAIKYDNHTFTYGQLWQAISKISLQLNKRLVQQTKIIAVALPRGIDLITSMCAIFNLRLIYMPIDLDLPEQRIKTILIDANPDLIICKSKDEARFTTYITYFIDEPVPEFYQLLQVPDVNLNNPAYLLYTSGTTGKPKGVLQTYRTITNLIQHQLLEFSDLKPGSTIMQCAAIGFDVSIQEITFALANGHSLIIVAHEDKINPGRLWFLIEQEKVNLMFIPPAILQLLSEYTPKFLNNVPQYFVVAGEALHITPNIRQLRKKYAFNLVNHYGPTETHVITTYVLPQQLEQWDDRPSIGKVITNCAYTVLDKNMQLVPPGVIGELYCYGDNLAIGYYNNPELTANKFIYYNNGNYVRRMYKTGDLVRQLNNNNLEYIGRSDQQVKIRGFRIELEEVEKTLMTYPEITRCLILVKILPSGDKCIIAYYSAKHKLDNNQIHDFITARLPEYMVPAAFIEIDTFPLTVNGKIDQQALPIPDLTKINSYIAPSNAIEEELCYIWADTLKIEYAKISVLDDFFKLGGNSLMVIRLINQINQKYSITLSIASFFNHRTIKKLALYLEHPETKAIIIEPVITNTSNLSFAQQRLWFIEQYQNGSNAYNIPLFYKLNPGTSPLALQYSINMITERHEILRTLLKLDSNGNAYQEVMPFKELQLISESLPDLKHLDDRLRFDAYHVFDLSNELPIKPYLYKIADEEFLSIVVHHVVFDGWSVDIFIHELVVGYKYWYERLMQIGSWEQIYYSRPSNLDLPKLTIQYKDFAVWQKQYLNKSRLSLQMDYWQEKLSNIETLNLFTDKQRPLQISYAGEYIDFKISKEVSQKLRSTARELNVSLYSVMLSAYYIFLAGYSNQKDIIVGSSVANRNYLQLENLIGFFVNNVALRCQINPYELVIDFIQRVGKLVLESQLHQDIPFEQIVENLQISRDSSRHPIFQVAFEVQNFGSNNEVNTILTRIDKRYYKVAKFDLTATIDDSDEILKGSFNYATALFNHDTVTSFISTYQLILEQFSNCIIKKCLVQEIQYCNTILPVSEISFEPISLYSNASSIQELFEYYAVTNPTQTSVVFKDYKLSYLELNQIADNLAAFLHVHYAVNKDVMVAICGDRSINTIVSMLAILKSGGAYVPIDPNYPNERIIYILQDTRAKLILTDVIQQEKLNKIVDKCKLQIDVLALDNGLIENMGVVLSKQDMHINTGREDLAYVIYTSGTTGEPKGVMLEHGGVINYIHNVKAKILTDTTDLVDFSTNLGFDLTVTCTLGALCSGNSIYIYDGDVRDIESYKNHLLHNKINIIKLVPSYFDLLCNILPKSVIKCAVLGGEKLEASLISKIPAGISVVNEYGPTETTVGACYHQFYSDDNTVKHTIGKAYANYKLYVCDEFLRQIPNGGIGELYISGVAVARGYLNQKNIQTFIDNPFSNRPGENKLYKTGDLVRVLSNGDLEYIGRNDSLIKINGYRIDLGEIAGKLKSYPLINNAVVVIKQNKTTQTLFLVAYYISVTKLDKRKLDIFLRQYLPDYMLPTVYMQIPQIPLTLHGKLDEKALPQVDFVDKIEYVAPQSESQKIIAKLFSIILKLNFNEVSIYTNFFKSGGNSILAIKLVSQIQTELGKKIKVSDIFVCKTIAAIAELVDSSSTPGIITNLVTMQPGKKNLFMIHPAIGGCEVYIDLAQQFKQSYICIGVDSYNLHNRYKIESLNSLAKLYLTEISKVMEDTGQDTYYMLGWSFGGQIALEIAYLLEQNGIKKICIILLDTVLPDSQMLTIRKTIDQKEFKMQFFNYMLSQGHEISYVEKIIYNLDTEFNLFKYAISGTLMHTQVLLLKAGQEDVRYDILESRIMDNYILSLPNNNIDKFLNSLEQLNTITLQFVNHGNILQNNSIVELIKSWIERYG